MFSDSARFNPNNHNVLHSVIVTYSHYRSFWGLGTSIVQALNMANKDILTIGIVYQQLLDFMSNFRYFRDNLVTVRDENLIL